MVTELVPVAGLPGKTRSSVYVSNEVSPRKHLAGFGKGVVGPVREKHIRDVLKCGARPDRSRPQRKGSARRPYPPFPRQAPRAASLAPTLGLLMWNYLGDHRPAGVKAGSARPDKGRRRAPGHTLDGQRAHLARRSPGADGVCSSLHSEPNSQKP